MREILQSVKAFTFTSLAKIRACKKRARAQIITKKKKKGEKKTLLLKHPIPLHCLRLHHSRTHTHTHKRKRRMLKPQRRFRCEMT